MLGKIEGRRRTGRQRMRWLDGITDSMPAGCWQWDGPWGCGGEGPGPRQAPAATDCPPCALAGPPPAPQPLPGDASFYSLPLPPPLPPTSVPPQPPAPSPSPSSSPSPQAVCWPSGWH